MAVEKIKTITDCNGSNLVGVKVTAIGSIGSNQGISNGTGDYSIFIPSNTPVTTVVKSNDYGNYSPEKSYNISGQSGGQTITQNISLPCIGWGSGTLGSGTIGSLTWDLTDGILTISGNGTMPDFSNSNFAPWYEFRNQILIVIIGNGVTNIGNQSISICPNLTSVTIGSGVTNINGYRFPYPGEYLTNIKVDNNNPNYSSIDGVLYNKSQTILYKCPKGKTGTVIIPNTVTRIGTQGDEVGILFLEIICLSASILISKKNFEK